MSNFTFNDRESYLNFRKEWKEDYKKLSDDIRVARDEYKEAMRTYHQHNKMIGALWTSISDYSNLKYEANKMLSNLHAAKAESARQYAESKVSV